MKKSPSSKSVIRILFVVFGLFVATIQESLSQLCGCTDSLAVNYNAAATINDGSCLYASTIIDATVIGTLDSTVDGTSSLLYWNEGFWTFNDHMDNCLYHIDTTTAEINNILYINGIVNYDIEEISQDSLYLYLGDVGNNSGSREDLHILRISKESILDQTFEVDTISFFYEDQTDFTYHPQATEFDCEAFIVSDDSIYLFTKQWNSLQTTIYSFPKTPGSHIAHRCVTYDVNGLITGATYIPECQLVALCGYDFDIANTSSILHPFIVLLYDFQGDNFFSGNKRRLDFDFSTWAQIEAVATHNALDFYLTSEHFETTLADVDIDLPAQLWHVNLRDYLLPYLSEFGVSDNPTNIHNHQNRTSEFKLYPNPVHDKLCIDFPQDFEGARYEIVNMLGRKVSGGVLKDNCILLNNRAISSGTYLLILCKDRERKSIFFIKND
ncbi:MAG: T9SS type A sorting domain-containing protein [Bacteroidales bacterium]|nr:T9SS type A sorting domain-containing protein [Bacteroidales bacterium]